MSGNSILVPAAAAQSAGPARQRPVFTWDNFLERPSEKIIFTFFGDKDAGKTREMLSLPGRHLVLSFDQKSKGVKAGVFQNDPRIWVVDAVQFYADAQPEDITFSASVTIDFLDAVLDDLAPKFHPHFIDFDGTEVFEQIAEMKMRFGHGLKMSEGFAERAWWKDRRAILRSLHRKAALVAGVGVCYTAYYDKTPAEEGSTHAKDKVPRWIDVMMQETDIAVDRRAFYNSGLKTKSYEAYVFGAKPHLADVVELGKVFDVTGKNVPWGPGLARKVADFDARMKGVEIVVPQESSVRAEARNELPPPPVVPVSSPSEASAPSPSALPSAPAGPSVPSKADEF